MRIIAPNKHAIPGLSSSPSLDRPKRSTFAINKSPSGGMIDKLKQWERGEKRGPEYDTDPDPKLKDIRKFSAAAVGGYTVNNRKIVQTSR